MVGLGFTTFTKQQRSALQGILGSSWGLSISSVASAQTGTVDLT